MSIMYILTFLSGFFTQNNNKKEKLKWNNPFVNYIKQKCQKIFLRNYTWGHLKITFDISICIGVYILMEKSHFCNIGEDVSPFPGYFHCSLLITSNLYILLLIKHSTMIKTIWNQIYFIYKHQRREKDSSVRKIDMF